MYLIVDAETLSQDVWKAAAKVNANLPGRLGGESIVAGHAIDLGICWN
jgi:hypothetical protein